MLLTFQVTTLWNVRCPPCTFKPREDYGLVNYWEHVQWVPGNSRISWRGCSSLKGRSRLNDFEQAYTYIYLPMCLLKWQILIFLKILRLFLLLSSLFLLTLSDIDPLSDRLASVLLSPDDSAQWFLAVWTRPTSIPMELSMSLPKPCWLPDQIKVQCSGQDHALLTFSASDPRGDTPRLKKNCMNWLISTMTVSPL